jgi:hypothetical protein
MYRKILGISDVDKLQTDVGRLGECAVENEMKINPGKSKALSFTRARVKNPLNYSFKNQRIPEASCCKCLGITVRSGLSWADQVNYMVQEAWKALVRPILDPYRECQINALGRVQKKAAEFAHHTRGLVWESLAQRRKIARMCALFKACTGERAWKAIGDRL